MPQRITTNFISAFAPFSSSLTCVVAVRSDASEGPGAFGIAKTERERERWRGIVSSERAAGAFLVEGEGEGLTNASGVEPEGLDWGDEVGGIDGRVQNEAGLAVEVAGEKPGLRSRSRWEGGRFLRWRSLNEREEEIASVDSLGDLGEVGARATHLWTRWTGRLQQVSVRERSASVRDEEEHRQQQEQSSGDLHGERAIWTTTGGATLGLAFLFLSFPRPITIPSSCLSLASHNHG